MTSEHIHKEAFHAVFNKHNELDSDRSFEYSIDIDVEINTELNSMCKDLLKLLRDKNVFFFEIVTPVPKSFDYEVTNLVWDMSWIKKIVFEDYYLMIDNRKILYNAIFAFDKKEIW